ncbi:MAG: oligoendopeptidase F, partial [Anaerolineales bacterium]
WNAESVFPSLAEWEAEVKRLVADIASVKQYEGKLSGGPQVVASAMEAMSMLRRRAETAGMYAAMDYYTDTTNAAAGERFGQAQGAVGQVLAAMAFIDPELIAIGEATLNEWQQAEPRLALYGQYLRDLFRQQAHVRSAEVEELLGLLADPFGSVSTTASMLTDADMAFREARAAGGETVAVSQGSYEDILAKPDREARRTAWESYTDEFLAHKNTLANNLATSIKQNVFQMRARRHTSTLGASLFTNNIPVEVFHNLIATFKKNLPTWHRYWRIRRKALGVETLHPYDIWAPLTATRPHVPYETAVAWICDGMAPLGSDYLEIVRRACLEQRWVDIYPNLGKFSGAFSSGVQGTHPFILMSYTDDLFGLSTLAHELGHSMHSYFSWQTQPYVYSGYSLFVAEVASNFNQAMVRAHLLKTHSERDFQISVIEEAMNNIHRYFFIMPTLARFELECHERVERGQGLNAEGMNSLMADLFTEAYGGEMAVSTDVDRDRVGITWGTFSHLYADYYVYQYATGISGAMALSKRILSGEPGTAEAYIEFLKTGSSLYPLDALKRAGVDLSTPAPVETAFGVLAGLVDRLETLVG